MSEPGGGDLFIVDNSVSGWAGLEYMRQWSDLARLFDIAYITHAKFDVVDAQALVGSSNFTKPGLTRNVELNIQVQA